MALKFVKVPSRIEVVNRYDCPFRRIGYESIYHINETCSLKDLYRYYRNECDDKCPLEARDGGIHVERKV